MVPWADYAEIPAGSDGTYADVMAAEATVALFKTVCLNLSSFVTAAPRPTRPLSSCPCTRRDSATTRPCPLPSPRLPYIPLLRAPEALAQRAPRVFDQAAATQVPGLRGATGTARSTSLDVDGNRIIANAIQGGLTVAEARGKIAAGLQARGLTAIALENSIRFQELGKQITAAINAAVSQTGTLRFATRGMYLGSSFPIIIDATTPGFNDPSKTLYDLAAAQFARVLVAEFGLTQEAAEQWVAENGNVQSLVDQFLFVDSGGNTFVRGDPRHLAPQGWITISMLSEITGERAALSSLDAVRVERYINELRQKSIASGVPITLRQALAGDEAQKIPAMREMLRLLAGYDVHAEGYTQLGTRYPTSLLLDLSLEELGLRDASLRLFDPRMSIKELCRTGDGQRVMQNLEFEILQNSRLPLQHQKLQFKAIRDAFIAAVNTRITDDHNIAYTVFNGIVFAAISTQDDTRQGTGIFIDPFVIPDTIRQMFSYMKTSEGAVNDFHSEAIILAKIYQYLYNNRGMFRGQTIPLKLFTERPPCGGCLFVMAQFMALTQALGIDVRLTVDWDRSAYSEESLKTKYKWFDPRDQKLTTWMNSVGNNPVVMQFFIDYQKHSSDPLLFSPEWWARRGREYLNSLGIEVL